MSKSLPKRIATSLAEKLEPFGFKLVKNGLFFRNKADRRELFLLQFINFGSEWRISIVISIRFHEVEEIYHRTSGRSPDMQQYTFTVNYDLGPDYELALRDENEVPNVISRLMQIFEEKAEPYYARFKTLFDVDAALNKVPIDDNIHAATHRLASVGLIVAKLTGRKDFESLLSYYQDQVKRYDGFYYPSFETLVADLRDL